MQGCLAQPTGSDTGAEKIALATDWIDFSRLRTLPLTLRRLYPYVNEVQMGSGQDEIIARE